MRTRSPFEAFALLSFLALAGSLLGVGLLIAQQEQEQVQDADNLRELWTRAQGFAPERAVRPTGPQAWIALFTGLAETAPDAGDAFAATLDAEQVALLLSPADPLADLDVAAAVIAENPADPLACVYPGWTEPAGDDSEGNAADSASENGDNPSEGEADGDASDAAEPDTDGDNGDDSDSESADNDNADGESANDEDNTTEGADGNDDASGDDSNSDDDNSTGADDDDSSGADADTQPADGDDGAHADQAVPPAPGAGWPVTSYAGPSASAWERLADGDSDTSDLIVGATGSRNGVGFHADGFAVVRANMAVEFLRYDDLLEDADAAPTGSAWFGLTTESTGPPWSAPALELVDNLAGPSETGTAPEPVEPPRWPFELTAAQEAEAADLYAGLEAAIAALDTAVASDDLPATDSATRDTWGILLPLATTYAASANREMVARARELLFDSLAAVSALPVALQRLLIEDTDAGYREIIERLRRDGPLSEASSSWFFGLGDRAFVLFVDRDRDLAYEGMGLVDSLDPLALVEQVVAAQLRKGVAENMIDRERVEQQERSYLDERRRTMKGEFAARWPMTLEVGQAAPGFRLRQIHPEPPPPTTPDGEDDDDATGEGGDAENGDADNDTINGDTHSGDADRDGDNATGGDGATDAPEPGEDESGGEGESGADPDSEPAIEGDADTAEPDADTEGAAEPEPEIESEPNVESGPEVESEPDVESEPEIPHVSLERLRGQVVLLAFWNSWSYACELYLPGKLKVIHERWGAELDFSVVSIGTHWSGQAGGGRDSEVEQREFIEQHDLPWTHVIDEGGDVTRAYYAPVVPYFVLVEIDGTVIRFGDASELDAIQRILALRFGDPAATDDAGGFDFDDASGFDFD